MKNQTVHSKEGKDMKQYVAVVARYDENGRIEPRQIQWNDGRVFEIDRVIDRKRRASMKAGGSGIRYTVRILGKERYLYLEENRWFVETGEKS